MQAELLSRSRYVTPSACKTPRAGAKPLYLSAGRPFSRRLVFWALSWMLLADFLARPWSSQPGLDSLACSFAHPVHVLGHDPAAIKVDLTESRSLGGWLNCDSPPELLIPRSTPPAQLGEDFPHGKRPWRGAVCCLPELQSCGPPMLATANMPIYQSKVQVDSSSYHCSLAPSLA